MSAKLDWLEGLKGYSSIPFISRPPPAADIEFKILKSGNSIKGLLTPHTLT